MEQLQLSSSLEDYLEAIAAIIEEKGHAHTKDIADHLKVKMPSVTNALQALRIRNLIVYQSHSPVVLTATGMEKAAVIRRRHANLKKFFIEILHLSESEANDAACRVEHVIGEKVTSRFVALGDAISTRDDAKPLREYLSGVLPNICDEPDHGVIPLSELPEGHQAAVVNVAKNLRGSKRFADLGIIPGTLVKMEGFAPFGDLLRIKVMSSSLSLRKSDADYISVKPTESGPEHA